MELLQVILVVMMAATLTVSQRPFFAGSRPIGYPEIIKPTTIASDAGLANKFGEGDSTTTTQRLPIEALGDRDLVDRLSKLPIDKQPFWLINWQALEANRQKPQTYPQRPSQFAETISPSNSRNTNTNSASLTGNSPNTGLNPLSVNSPSTNLALGNRNGGVSTNGNNDSSNINSAIGNKNPADFKNTDTALGNRNGDDSTKPENHNSAKEDIALGNKYGDDENVNSNKRGESVKGEKNPVSITSALSNRNGVDSTHARDQFANKMSNIVGSNNLNSFSTSVNGHLYAGFGTRNEAHSDHSYQIPTLNHKHGVESSHTDKLEAASELGNRYGHNKPVYDDDETVYNDDFDDNVHNHPIHVHHNENYRIHPTGRF